MFNRLKGFVAATAIVAGISASAGAALAEWPEKPIKMFVGSSAGGGTDTYARVLSGLIHEELDGVPMAVINRPGAGSMIALKEVADQDADGYTVLMQAVGPVVVNELQGKSPVDFRKEMVPIGVLGQVPIVLTVPYDSPYQSLQELVTHATENPGEMRWASAGRDDYLGVGFSKIAERMGLDVQDVPFKGGGPAKAAVVAEQVDFSVLGEQHLVGFESKLRGLGVFSPERSALLPEIPTFAEQGYEVANLTNVFAVYVKAGTPDDIVQRLRDAVATTVQKEEYKALLAKAGLTDTYLNAEESAALLDQMFEDLTD